MLRSTGIKLAYNSHPTEALCMKKQLPTGVGQYVWKWGPKLGQGEPLRAFQWGPAVAG